MRNAVISFYLCAMAALGRLVPRRRVHRSALLIWLTALVACSSETTRPVTERVESIPGERLDFGAVATGMASLQELRLVNQGQGTVQLEALDLPEGFSLERNRLSLKARESVALQVEFLPRQERLHEGWIRFRTSGSQGEVRVEVRGEGVSAAVEVQDALEFGGVFLSRNKTLPLDLRNSTDLPLELEVVLEGDAAYSINPSSLIVPPRGAGSLEVAFLPQERGPATASLLLRPCPRCKEMRVSLQGRGMLAQLEASPDPLEFGYVPLGLVGRRTLTVRSASDGPISLGASSWASGPEGRFFGVETPVEPEPLKPGEEVDLVVAFTPDSDGRYRDTLFLRDGDGVTLLEVEVSGIEGGPRLTFSPPRLDFGSQPQGRRLTAKVMVENVGAPGEAWIRSTSLEGEGQEAFSVEMASLPIDVGEAPGEMEVTLEPAALGRWEASLVVQTDLAAQAKLRLPISVDLIDPSPCHLVADREELRFGAVESDYDGVRTVTVKNEGGQRCLVWGIHVENAGETAPFRLDLSLEDPFTLEANESLMLPIRFDASEAPVNTSHTTTYVSAELVIPHGRVGDQALVIPMSGMRMRWKWHIPPSPPAFEATPVGRATVAEATIAWACGKGLTRLALSPESSPAFQIPVSQPIHLCIEEGSTIRIAFFPGQEGLHSGQLELRDSWGPSYLLDFEATAIPPCEDCDWPEAYCLEDTALTVAEELEIHDEWQHDCGWGIMHPPSLPGFEDGIGNYFAGWRYGLQLEPYYGYGPSTVCAGSFRAHTAATYRLGNLRVRPDWRAAYCESTIQALPKDGLWVETYSMQAGWLYALRGIGGDPTEEASWLDGTHVCPYLTGGPGGPCPWGDPGPVVCRRGGESIHVEGPEVGETYHIGLRVLESTDFGLRIYCGGQLAHEGTMSIGGIDGPLGALVVLGSVHFDTPTSCTFTSDGVTNFPGNNGPFGQP